MRSWAAAKGSLCCKPRDLGPAKVGEMLGSSCCLNLPAAPSLIPPPMLSTPLAKAEATQLCKLVVWECLLWIQLFPGSCGKKAAGQVDASSCRFGSPVTPTMLNRKVATKRILNPKRGSGKFYKIICTV